MHETGGARKTTQAAVMTTHLGKRIQQRLAIRFNGRLCLAARRRARVEKCRRGPAQKPVMGKHSTATYIGEGVVLQS